MRSATFNLHQSFLVAVALSFWLACPAVAQNPHGQRPGACCVTTTSGSLVCITATQADCSTLGGQFAGVYVPCTSGNPCPGAPTGACCLPSPGQGNGRPGGGGPLPRCIIANEVQCTNQGGTFQGNGTSCTPVPCPPPPPVTGACCFAGGVCTNLTSQACRQQGGNFRGNNSSCAAAPCPGAPVGACCIVRQSGGSGGLAANCIMTNAVSCSLQGGTYQGDRILCRNANCPPPPPRTGACCRGGTCTVATQQDCRLQGGMFHGYQSVCATTVCPGAPTGACCVAAPGGQMVPCVILTQAGCNARGGVYQGDQTACASVTCISPSVGACCVQVAAGAFNCIEINPAACTILGGVFGGSGVPCASVSCPPACPCDINADGVVDALDEAAFLALWFSGNADLDGDGDTDADDLALFSTCYPQGCP